MEKSEGWGSSVIGVELHHEQREIKACPTPQKPDPERESRPRQNQSVCGWVWGLLDRTAHGWPCSVGLWSSIFSVNLLDVWNFCNTSEEFFHRWTRERVQDIGE